MIVIIEPFYAGSHKYMCDFLAQWLKSADQEVKLFTMEGKKWHWRMLVSAAHFATCIPQKLLDDSEDHTIIISAMMNVAEFFGLRQDLAQKTKLKVLYFHENQLKYPKSSMKAKCSKGQNDFGLVYNQIISCFAVNQIVFNSNFNMESFLNSVDSFLNQIPTKSRPEGTRSMIIRAKSSVLPVPVLLPITTRELILTNHSKIHIIWAHRWEHDKNPELFIDIVRELHNSFKLSFAVSVLGSHSKSDDFQASFESARKELSGLEYLTILHWGEIEDRKHYLNFLKTGHIAVSTARHEFFGLSMLEQTFAGCYPLCPNRLSYPELFPKECLYSTSRQLVKSLRHFIRNPAALQKARGSPKIRECLEKISWHNTAKLWATKLGLQI